MSSEKGGYFTLKGTFEISHIRARNAAEARAAISKLFEDWGVNRHGITKVTKQRVKKQEGSA